jgi:hypothetical protein
MSCCFNGGDLGVYEPLVRGKRWAWDVRRRDDAGAVAFPNSHTALPVVP